MKEELIDSQCCEVPLTEQLLSVPEDYRTCRAIQWSESGEETGHQFIPVGYMMLRAAKRIQELEAAAAPLLERIAELEKDAARYRWLRKNCQYGFEDTDEPQLIHRNGESGPHQNVNWREDLDNSIDTALQHKEKTDGTS